MRIYEFVENYCENTVGKNYDNICIVANYDNMNLNDTYFIGDPMMISALLLQAIEKFYRHLEPDLTKKEALGKLIKMLNRMKRETNE